MTNILKYLQTVTYITTYNYSLTIYRRPLREILPDEYYVLTRTCSHCMFFILTVHVSAVCTFLHF